MRDGLQLNSRIKIVLIIIAVLSGSIGLSQNNLSDLLKQYNTNNIPYISVQELAMPKIKALILDAREFKEYEISHLKNAVFVGFNTFDLSETTLLLKDKQQTIVVYCSLGIRSEKIAEKLQKAGYINVYNLYGGIFEWKNKGFPVYDSNEAETDEIHVFSKAWGKWVRKGQKIYN